VFVIAIITGIISGLYPAFFISSISPTEIISRGRLRSGKKGFTFRNILVVFQFTVSIFLITSTLIVDEQMQYVRNKKLGYDKDNIVNIPMHDNASKLNSELFKSKIIPHTNILGAAATSFTPSVEKWREAKNYEGKTEEDDVAFFRMSCDYDFIDLFGLNVIAGRKFDKNYTADLGNAFILNETAVKEIGWTPEEAVGKWFNTQKCQVIGVVKDFNYQSLRRETKALAINILPKLHYYLSVKINPNDISGTLKFLEQKWSEVNPASPFEFYFLDEEFDKIYKADERMENLLSTFSFIAILLACMGLFGLSLFKVNSKLKEIGIRKVIGASLPSLMILLLKDLLKLIVIGIFAAVPAIYLIMSNWLQEFAYRIDIEIFVFIISGTITLFISFATVSYLIIRAARTNPVDVLKYE
ncbi:ABC transporter permease, partial [Bacteroidota bacterium]